jgi:hypothetical protein
MIAYASGLWIHHAIGWLRKAPEVVAMNQMIDKQIDPVMKLVEEIKKVIPKNYAGFVSEEFLTSKWHFYSVEFAFAVAYLCRKIGGPNHTKTTTENIALSRVTELFPIELLDLVAAWVIEEALLGGKVKFKNVVEQKAEIEISYPVALIGTIPQWKLIADIQHPIIVKKVLGHYWGLRDMELTPIPSSTDSLNKTFQAFNYKLQWQGGEHLPKEAMFNSSNSYFKRKVSLWFEMLDSLYSDKLEEASESLMTMMSVREPSHAKISSSQDELESLVKYFVKKKLNLPQAFSA